MYEFNVIVFKIPLGYFFPGLDNLTLKFTLNNKDTIFAFKNFEAED